MRILKEFLDDIKSYNKKLILKKLSTFQYQIENSNCINVISKGFWIRRIINTDIYKIRINNGDRVLFTFDKNNNNELVFLKYCNHDKQILDGKSINKNIKLHVDKSLEINLNEYEEEEIGNLKEEIDYYTKIYMSAGLESLSSIVLEDEYIAISLEENSDEYLYYLNQNQFECLKVIGKPIIISGCAGSGKTMIGIHKLLSNNDINTKSAYITYSYLLKNQSENKFNKFNKRNTSVIDFICINEFFSEKLDIDFRSVIKYNDFERWFIKNFSSVEDLKIDPSILYNEINKKNSYKDSYKYDGFDKYEIKLIQKVYSRYEDWINVNNYIDEIRLTEKFMIEVNSNKIILPKYDFIFVDEIQDLRDLHLKFIYSVLSIKENIIFSGDVNQIVNNSNFEFNIIKKQLYENNIIYEEKFINKNYRNTSGVVNFINKLINLRINKIGKSKKEYDQYEEYIREGKPPYIIPYKENNIRCMSENLNERNYCAIVVPSYAEKHKLIIEGANKDRIFTINDIKGLEYRNIFCINFISAYKDYWKMINKKNDKPYLRHFFNILYVAITRGINVVAFIEEDVNLAKKILGQDFLYNMKEIDLNLLEMSSITDAEGWLNEAKKLEDSLDYGKAYYAYKKANSREGMNRCKIFMRKIKDDHINQIFGNVNETAIRIEKNSGVLTYNDIYFSIQKIFNKHYVYSKGNVDLVFQDKNRGTIVSKLKDLDEANIIKQVSIRYIDCIKELKNAKKNKVTIYMTFYYLNSPKRILLSNGDVVNLIRVDTFNSNKGKSKILLKYEYLESLNASSMLKELGIYESETESDYTDFGDAFFSTEYLMSEAGKHMDKGNYCEAIKYYNKIISEDRIEDYINKFNTADKLNDASIKIEKSEGAKINNINDFDAYIKFNLYANLGMCYKENKLYDEAYKYLKKSINYMSEQYQNNEYVLFYTNVFLNIGDIFIIKEDNNEAYKYFEKAIRFGDPRGIKGIALVNFRNNNLREALDFMEIYLDKVPIDINGHLKMVEYFATFMSNEDGSNFFTDEKINNYYEKTKYSYEIVKKNIENVSKKSNLVKVFEENFL
ncbi:hypothetical protein KW95_04155 [Clostridioides difficile]|nr:hypothetical protein KW95_04155 [Clostridioides difficile]